MVNCGFLHQDKFGEDLEVVVSPDTIHANLKQALSDRLDSGMVSERGVKLAVSCIPRALCSSLLP